MKPRQWASALLTLGLLLALLGLLVGVETMRSAELRPPSANNASPADAPGLTATITNTYVLSLPVIIDDTSAASATLQLPDTGQVSHYTPTVGEDADYTLNPPTYTAHGDGTVTDQVTGLVWQQSDGGELTFTDAVSYCANLTLGGYSDWQLPAGADLFTLVDLDRNPALNTTAFTMTSAEYWWSANELMGDPTRAWVVNAGGGIGPHPKSEALSAGGAKYLHPRCVRNVPTRATIHFTANADATVTDARTGLVWQQAEVTATMTWEAALSYCENLTLGSNTAWRLPNSKDLRSLNDETLINPSLDTTYFPGAQATRYWSSTTLAGRTDAAWFTDFTSGLVSYNAKTGLLAVRCVRSS